MRVMVRTYVLALIGLLAIGFAILYVASVVNTVTPAWGEPRPTEAQLASYDIEYRTPDSPSPTTLQIGTDGAACDALRASELLSRACVLALNVDPAFIAGEAFGRLNSEDTAAYEAIIWRARIDGDASICERGGLLDGRLLACRAAVAAPTYERTDHGLTVAVGAPT